MSRLAVGTAQFGGDYGITNAAGQVNSAQAAAILEFAHGRGMDTVDTARLYGDSELVIGQCSVRTSFRIVTKTGKYAAIADAQLAAEELRADLMRSLNALRQESVFAVLIHDAADLLGRTGPALWAAMERLKASAKVEKIGVSIYEADEAYRILERFPVDIVQLPFNAIDDRLLNEGQLGALAAAGIEIHARSLFLQGLLLAPSASIPARFAPVRCAIDRLDAWCGQTGFSRLEGLLALAFRRTEISRFVVGVTSTRELDEIADAAERIAAAEPFDLPHLPAIDAQFLNPARWSELKG